MGSCRSAEAALEVRPAPGLELGRGGEVLVPPDPADPSTLRVYSIAHLISSYKIVVSLSPGGAAESQSPGQELLRAGWERGVEREQDWGFSQRVQMGFSRAEGGCSWP